MCNSWCIWLGFCLFKLFIVIIIWVYFCSVFFSKFWNVSVGIWGGLIVLVFFLKLLLIFGIFVFIFVLVFWVNLLINFICFNCCCVYLFCGIFRVRVIRVAVVKLVFLEGRLIYVVRVFLFLCCKMFMILSRKVVLLMLMELYINICFCLCFCNKLNICCSFVVWLVKILFKFDCKLEVFLEKGIFWRF